MVISLPKHSRPGDKPANIPDGGIGIGSPRHEALKNLLAEVKLPDPGKSEAHWIRRFVPETLDRLREHPVFLLGSSAGTANSKSTARSTFVGQSLQEENREPLFVAELLRILRSRIRLVAGVGVALIPIFTAFYFYLCPTMPLQIVWVNALMVIALLTCNVWTGIINKLAPMRALALTSYVAFCSGAAWVVSIVTHDINFHGDASHNVQFVVMGSFMHILLSILLLPFCLLEAIFAALVALTALTWGLTVSMPTNTTYLSQLFVVFTSSLMVMTISHLSSVLRRNAFDAAFDLALQATRMQEMSATDAVTGGYNRRYAENMLGLEIARAGRFSHSLSLMMFDLDNFKPVNDQLGHSAGDEVLRQVWRAGTMALREVDTIARFGGDEFIIVLPETSAVAARNISERLRTVVANQLREKFGVDSVESRVTLSMGVLTVDGRDYVDIQCALARVDELLYDAKRGGKNRTAIGTGLVPK